jgi:hypothetical protein
MLISFLENSFYVMGIFEEELKGIDNLQLKIARRTMASSQKSCPLHLWKKTLIQGST